MSRGQSDNETGSPRDELPRSSGILSNLRLVSLCTLSSRILGLIRDAGMASVFGAGSTLDAFVLAFRIPNLARQLFGEGALSTAFLPVFVREYEQHGIASARQTLTAVARTLVIFLSLAIGLCEILIGGALLLVDLGPSTRLLLELLGLMLPYTLFICLAALLSAALHSLREFFWPAVVPVVLNVVWGLGLAFVWWGLADESLRIRCIAGTIVFAGCLQACLPLVACLRRDLTPDRNWRNQQHRVREVITAMLPVLLGISLTQVSAVFDSLLAWFLAVPDDGSTPVCVAWGIPAVLESGTAAALYIGQRMYQFPLGLLGIALGTVLFPVLARHAERGQFDRLRHDLTHGMIVMVALSIPASAGLWLLGTPITQLLFQRGAFDAEDARLTALMISTYGAAVWAFVGLIIVNRAFYAVGDRVTPMKLGLIALILNIIANLALVGLVGGVGLAWGTILATVTQLTLTVRRLEQRVGSINWNEVGSATWKAALGTVLMSAVILATQWIVPSGPQLSSRMAALLVPMSVGTATYLGAAAFLRLPAVFEFLGADSSVSKN